MGKTPTNNALNAAAGAVRDELVRCGYAMESEEPEPSDKTIAIAAIRAWMAASFQELGFYQKKLLELWFVKTENDGGIENS